MPPPIIAVEHVDKSVTDSTGTLDILRDIDFSLAPRETAAIVGASGSGKSTLLSIIAGLDTPTRGTVFIDGVDLFARDEDVKLDVVNDVEHARRFADKAGTGDHYLREDPVEQKTLLEEINRDEPQVALVA